MYKRQILNCEYRPNEFLNEQKLCSEMGNISRTPMRDALGRLEQEGLITILPKKGLMVSGITEEMCTACLKCVCWWSRMPCVLMAAASRGSSWRRLLSLPCLVFRDYVMLKV